MRGIEISRKLSTQEGAAGIKCVELKRETSGGELGRRRVTRGEAEREEKGVWQQKGSATHAKQFKCRPSPEYSLQSAHWEIIGNRISLESFFLEKNRALRSIETKSIYRLGLPPVCTLNNDQFLDKQREKSRRGFRFRKNSLWVLVGFFLVLWTDINKYNLLIKSHGNSFSIFYRK